MVAAKSAMECLLQAAIISLCLTAVAPRVGAQVLLGDQTIEPSVDSNAVGQAEAFQVTASLTGSVGSLTVYLDTTSAATTLYIGLYADNGGHPGALLTQGSSSTLNKAAWNTIQVPAANVVVGTRYWVAILGTAGGKPAFRDRISGSCSSEGSSQSNLQQLPASWTTGAQYTDCPLSAYGTASVAATPVLSVSPLSVSLTATVGGSDPLPFTLAVNNTGTGTLNFTASSDSSWLQVSPAQGTAPATLQASATGAGLGLGSYTGHITLTANGAQGSPAVITVNLTVAKVADWLMVDHDPNRSGNAVDETTITTSNVGSLQLSWSVTVDGPVTAQPLFVGGAGVQKDMLVVATGGNSIYAFDASTGAILWRRNFGTQPSNCAIPGGYGVTGAPLIDRNTGRVYTVSNDGAFRTLNLTDGTDAAPALPLISNPATNKVWGGLNKVGNYVYVATASDGCDTAPWRGQVYRVDVSANPVASGSWVVVPGIAAPNGGGGIWGYGGVSADPGTGIIYAASGSDSQNPEGYTPYANRMIALDGNLNLLGSYGPAQPANFPCNGAPCDLDFGSTPLVFQPAGCPTMVTTGNKNGVLYLFKATDLAASAMPFQSLTLNAANDWLGSGGIGGVPAYWASGNMLFVVTAGSGTGGIAGGVIGLNVNANCSLSVAWSAALGGSTQPNSTPTVANGIVFAGEGANGTIHAYDARTGAPLWTSGSQYGAAATYAAPIVAQGHVYAGSWSNFSGGGIVGAFSLSSQTPVLAVSPLSLSFSAQQNGTNPAAKSVSVTNTGIGTLNMTAVSDSPWLQVTPSSGAAPQTLQVSVNVAGLAANTYTGHITISAAGAQGSPASVTVTLTVAPNQPALSITPTTISLSAVAGSSNPAAVPLAVTNSGTGTLTFTAASDSPWLTVSPASGTAPQTLQVAANISGLTANTYTGHITVTSVGALNSPAVTTVTLTVSAPPPPQPILSVAPGTLSFSATQGGSNPAAATVNVTNTGTGTLNFTAASDSSWLTVTPASGTAPLALQVSANISGLTAGTYTGHVTVTSAGAQNSPATVNVSLTISAAGTVLLGDQAIEPQVDSNVNGQAEAFQTTATVSGALTSLSFYLDSSSTVGKVYLGVYSNGTTHPQNLLTQGSSTQLTKGAWNVITVPSASITAGTTYWIAILGTTSGKVAFRDRARGSCKSEGSSQTNLTALPAVWTSGPGYTDCPISAFGR